MRAKPRPFSIPGAVLGVVVALCLTGAFVSGFLIGFTRGMAEQRRIDEAVTTAFAKEPPT